MVSSFVRPKRHNRFAETVALWLVEFQNSVPDYPLPNLPDSFFVKVYVTSWASLFFKSMVEYNIKITMFIHFYCTRWVHHRWRPAGKGTLPRIDMFVSRLFVFVSLFFVAGFCSYSARVHPSVSKR